MKKPKATLKPPKLWTVFSDTTNQSYSWARVACSVLLVFIIIWGSWIVYYKSALPDFTTSALLFGAIYGLNRAGEVTQSVIAKKTNGNGDKK